MLDAYIIEKIKREQERREYERIPLHIERVPGHRRGDDEEDDKRGERGHGSERGVVIIDF